jgi:hypothetical protein
MLINRHGIHYKSQRISQEATREYRIISYDPKNVCLVHESDNAVMVITMNSDIGSFVVSMTSV